MFQKVDLFIIHSLEKYVSQPFQRLTGKNNFFLCRCAIVLFVAFQFLRAVHSYRLFGSIDWIGLFAALVWMIYPSTVLVTLEDQIKSDAQRGLSNKLKNIKQEAFFRLLWFGVTLQSLLLYEQTIGLSILMILKNLSLWLALTFMACDPLPPSKSKIRQWLESFSKQPEIVVSES